MAHYKSYRVRLEPNNVQRTMFARHAGCARHAYNWALATSELMYDVGGIKGLSGIDLNKIYIEVMKSSNPWLYDVSKCCTQQAIYNYAAAIKNFHRLQKPSNYNKKKLLNKRAADGSKVYVLEGLPHKKRKNASTDSFYTEDGGQKPMSVKGNKVRIPRIGWVKVSEDFGEGVEFKNCVISRTASDWFISFRTEFEPTKHKNKGRVGVDLGIKTLATVSNGMTFPTPKKLKSKAKQLARAQRSVSRKYESWKALTQKINAEKDEKEKALGLPKSEKIYPEKGSNYKKGQKKVAKLHKSIADERKDGLHKLTSYLTKNHSEVVIEDLAVKNMLKNRNLSKQIANGSWYEFRRQMEYKGSWYGCKIIIADRFFASSKLCSCCGFKNTELKLQDRVWACKNCGERHDRDFNASYNLRNYRESDYTGSSPVKVCGEGSPARKRSPSLKQKQNFKPAKNKFE